MSTRQVRPLGPRVLVRPRQKVLVSDGGIHMPENFINHGQKIYGLVEGVGTKDCEDLKEGDIVVFEQFSGNSIPGDDSRLLIHVKNLLGVIH